MGHDQLLWERIPKHRLENSRGSEEPKLVLLVSANHDWGNHSHENSGVLVQAHYYDLLHEGFLWIFKVGLYQAPRENSGINRRSELHP